MKRMLDQGQLATIKYPNDTTDQLVVVIKHAYFVHGISLFYDVHHPTRGAITIHEDWLTPDETKPQANEKINA